MKARHVLAALVLSVGLVTTSVAQDDSGMHDLLSEVQPYDCSDIAYNAMMLIPRLYSEGSLDSIHLVLDSWEEYCGPNYQTLSTTILMAIYEGTFSEELYDSTIVVRLLNSQTEWERLTLRSAMNHMQTRPSDPWFAYESYMNFTIEWAEQLTVNADTSSLEFLLATFYAGRSREFFLKLQDANHEDTKLRHSYETELKRQVKRAKATRFWMLQGGGWLPLGSLSKLGAHPNFGVAGGQFKGKLGYTFSFFGMTGQARDKYYVHVDRIADTVGNATVYSVALDFCYTFATGPRSRTDATLGLRYDGLRALGDNTDEAPLFSLGPGVGLRRWWYMNKGKSMFVGVYLRVDWMRYQTGRSGDDLYGVGISTGVSLGYCARSMTATLKRLAPLK